MGLKILHSADWHLDSPFLGFPEEQRAYLRAQQRKIPGLMADLCAREACDLVLLGGDLFDGAASPDTVRILKDALARMGVPVFISPGNHDYIAPGCPWIEEKWPENVHVFQGGITSVALPELDCRVYGAGYGDMDCPGLLEGFRAQGTEKFQIGLLHADPMQQKSPYCPITAAQVRDSGLNYLALGHIHKAGQFRAGNTLCGWPGCPMGRGYDELEEKGAYIVSIDKGAEIRFAALNTPQFYDLETDTGEDALTVLEAVLPAGQNDAFYRVTLTGSGEGGLPELYGHFSHLPNLELRDRREEKTDLWQNAGTDTLEGLYFSLLREKMEDSPEMAQTAYLAAEISRKLLLGKEVAL